MAAVLTTPHLLGQWLADTESVPIYDDASVALVQGLVRERSAGQGLRPEYAESLVVAASELMRNHLVHGAGGYLGVRAIARDGVPGLEVVAADQGPGIADPARALLGSYSSRGTLGIGLSGARRMADEMDLDVRWGQGTCVWVRRFAAGVPRGREVGVLGAPMVGECISGDHAVFVRRDRRLVLGVVDGLGHGEPAWEAAARAGWVVRERAGDGPAEVLEAADDALMGTRGGVMAVVVADDKAGQLEHAGVGDVRTRLYDDEVTRRLSCAARVLGTRAVGRRPAFKTEREVLRVGTAVVLSTDGLPTQTELPATLLRQGQHPLVLAQHLLKSFARGRDDVMVLVAR